MTAILAALADPKLSVSLIALIANLVAHFTGADPTQAQTLIAPLYVYVLAKAHSESGHTASAATVKAQLGQAVAP